MKKALTLFLVCIYTFSAVSSIGLVYCQSADGHSAIEPVHDSRQHCATTHEDHRNHDHDDNDFSVEHDHPCEPCVDTPIQIDDQIVNKKNDQPDDSPFKFSLVESSFFQFKTVESVQLPRPPPRTSSTLAYLRTVVLLV